MNYNQYQNNQNWYYIQGKKVHSNEIFPPRVIKDDKWAGGDTLQSDEVKRYVTTNHRNMFKNILPTGSFSIPFWWQSRDFAELFYIDLSAKKIEISPEETRTVDGISVVSKISFSIRVKNNDKYIARLFENEVSETLIFIDAMKQGVRNYVAQKDYYNLQIPQIQDLNYLLEVVNSYLNLQDFCFNLDGLLDSTFIPKDVTLADSLQNIRRAKEEELLKIGALKAKEERINKEKEIEDLAHKRELEKKRLDFEHKLMLKSMEEKHLLEIENIKSNQKRELEVLEIEMQMKYDFLKKEKMLEMYSNNPNAPYVLFTKESFENDLAKYRLEILDKQERNALIRQYVDNVLNYKNSFREGQMEILKTIIQQRYGISIADLELSLPDNSANLLNSIIDKNKENKEK